MCKAITNARKYITRLEKPTLDRNASVFELNERYEEYSSMLSVTEPEKVYTLLKEMVFEDQEYLGAIYLNSANIVVGIKEITKGLVNQTPIHPREAFREAIRKNAASVIFFHNHPSGSRTPSSEDFGITRTLAAAGKILQIPVLDHIILAKGGFTSILRADPEIFK